MAKRSSKKKHKERSLEEKWSSYAGTGITAKKGKNAIALREAVGGGEFAIVKLIGGCWSDSTMEVLEEVKTSSLEIARERFNTLVQQLGFKTQPIRTPGLLFDFIIGLHK